MRNCGHRLRLFVIFTPIVCLAFTSYLAKTTAASESLQFQNSFVCIDSPWAYGSLGNKSGAVFMKILAKSDHSEELLSATSRIAKRVEIHDFLVKSGMTVMESANNLQFNDSAPLVLKPKGLHIMLMDLDGQITPETSIPVTLNFKQSGKIQLHVQVISVDENPPEHSTKCTFDSMN